MEQKKHRRKANNEVGDIDINTIEKYEKMIEREGTRVKLTPPGLAMAKKRKCTVTFRTLRLPRKKFDIAPEEDIEKHLKTIRGNTVSY